jgi:catechol 2,3-dioxygenase-like lactoylglutathione lyase family enzyme
VLEGDRSAGADEGPAVEAISAITLATHDMARAVRFYRALGFSLRYGGEGATFTSFRAGSGYLNLTAQTTDRRWAWWGRVIFQVSDVDALYDRAVSLGLAPQSASARCGLGRALLPSH